MTAIGGMYLRFRQWSQHGLVTAYFRDVVCKRILSTSPVTETHDGSCEIHILTCASDWLNTIWTLKSFYRFSGRSYRLCIHEDGSLSQREIDTIAAHFPSAKIIVRAEADARILDLLKDRPLSTEFRRTNPLSLKVFDFGGFLDADRMLLLDSDLLFFAAPDELVRRVEDPAYDKNSLNRDWGYGYSISPETGRRLLGDRFQDRVNSGLGLIHRSSIQIDDVEEWLAVDEIWSHHHRVEQTLIGLYSCRFGHEFLPREYDVHLGPFGDRVPCCRHFTGPIRHQMYRDGMKYLVHKGFLNE